MNEIIIEVGKYFTSVAVITAGIVWLGKYIFDNGAKSLLKKYENDLKKEFEKEKIQLQQEKESSDRKLEEIRKWTNPILSSVNGLIGRLNHIIKEKGYIELDNSHDGYKYYFPTTVYYFAQYLCWIQILKEEINYEIFDEDDKRSTFFQAIKDVNIAIREYNSSFDFNDRGHPIYSLQQREISEIMRVEGTNRCIGYSTFSHNFSKEEGFLRVLEPINNLFEKLNLDSKEFKRIEIVLDKLLKLQKECKIVLKGIK